MCHCEDGECPLRVSSGQAVQSHRSSQPQERRDCHPFAKPVLSMPTVSGSMILTTGFDKPVLSFVEGLRTNGWHIEGLWASAYLVARNDGPTQVPQFAIV